MKRAAHKNRSAFLQWWNEVAPNFETASRYELAMRAWQDAKRDAAKRRKLKASHSASVERT